LHAQAANKQQQQVQQQGCMAAVRVCGRHSAELPAAATIMAGAVLLQQPQPAVQHTISSMAVNRISSSSRRAAAPADCRSGLRALLVVALCRCC
jgi:hypothetical protein